MKIEAFSLFSAILNGHVPPKSSIFTIGIVIPAFCHPGLSLPRTSSGVPGGNLPRLQSKKNPT
jgi:hypothetical protein